MVITHFHEPQDLGPGQYPNKRPSGSIPIRHPRLQPSTGDPRITVDGVSIIPSPTDTFSSNVLLPRLQYFRLRGIPGTVVDWLLRRILVTAEVITQFHVGFLENPSSVDSNRFLLETLLPFVQVYKRLNPPCDGPGSHLMTLPSGGFTWNAHSNQNYRFSLVIPTVQFSTSLRWLEDVIGTDGPGMTTTLYLRGVVPEPLQTLKRSKIVSGLLLVVMAGIECLDPVLDVLEGAKPEAGIDSISDEVPGFPALDMIHLINWPWNLSKVEKMLTTRFSRQRSMGLSFPDLQVELGCPLSRALAGPQPERILHLETMQRVRSLEGVKGVRLRKKRAQPGFLAVVWSEELSQPVCG